MQSTNLQYQGPHVMENMRSGGLQYDQPNNFHGETRQFAEDMRSGGLQPYNPNDASHHWRGSHPLPVEVSAEKPDRPVELPLTHPRENKAPVEKIFGLRRRIFWLLAAIIGSVVIGAVVGGALAGTQKRQSTSSTDPSSTGAVSAISTNSDTLVSPSMTRMTSSRSAGITAGTSQASGFTNSDAPAAASTVTTSPTSSNGVTSTAAQPTAPAPTFSSDRYYRFTNMYLGTGTALDVVNDNGVNSSGTLQMAATGNYSGQYWQIVGSPTSGYYLRTEFLGPSMRLDVNSGSGPAPLPRLAPAASGDSQIWTFTSWGDGTYKVVSRATGDGVYLDTYSDTKQLFMEDGNHSGQHWTITDTGPM